MGPKVRVRRQLWTPEIQGETEGLGRVQKETGGQRAEGRGVRKESETGLEARLRIWEWTQEQRRHLRAQMGDGGQEGLGQGLRGRAFRRVGWEEKRGRDVEGAGKGSAWWLPPRALTPVTLPSCRSQRRWVSEKTPDSIHP